jgi:hypothetical protein
MIRSMEPIKPLDPAAPALRALSTPARWLLPLAGLALLWLVREQPWQPLALVRLDGLSALFALLALGAAALEPGPALTWRRAALLAALAPALLLTALLPLAAAYAALAALTLWMLEPQRSAGAQIYGRGRALLAAADRLLTAAAPLLAAGCLLAGYGALALQGAARYDERTAGLGLSSFAFWFVLLAAALPLAPLLRARPGPLALAARLAWLYPLLRLYSVGPWNSGWSFATLLLGGAAALWAALEALLAPDQDARARHAQSCYLGLALAAFGLSSGAGLAAGCYCLLVALLLAVPRAESQAAGATDEGRRTKDEAVPLTSLLLHLLTSPWLLSPALPLTGPFVAVWLVVGAGAGGGVTALSGAAWMAGLLLALGPLLQPAPPLARRAGALSLALGVGAPLALLALAEPLIAQLQGGLTPYGDVAIWPWVGVAAQDAAKSQVAALPSLAVAGLMLVLGALVYLLARLRADLRPPAPVPAEAPAAEEPFDLARLLRREVPWLGGAAREEERPVDRE